MKECSRCHHEKPLSDFGVRKDRIQSYCKDCQKKASAEWYQKNKKHHVSNVRKNTRAYQAKFQEYKSALMCACCSEDENICLDFHHIDPTQKDFQISLAIRKSWSWDRVEAEIQKCVILCSNCHRKVHVGIIPLPL